MNVLKVILTLLLAILLLVGCLATELLALVRQTVLDPSFYDARQQQAYMSLSRALLWEWSALTLRSVPAEVLRATDHWQAYELATGALPPERIAAVLSGSLPDIVRWARQGGRLPVLLGSQGFPAMADDMMAALLKPGLWHLQAARPSLPLIIPFTADWNDTYGAALEQSMVVPRYYGAVYDNVIFAAVGFMVLSSVVLGVLWRRRRGVFYAVLGTVLLLNAVLVAYPSVLLTFFSDWGLTRLADIPVLSPIAAFLGPEYLPFCRALLEPFRGILVVLALGLASLSLASFTVVIDRRTIRSTVGVDKKQSARS